MSYSISEILEAKAAFDALTPELMVTQRFSNPGGNARDRRRAYRAFIRKHHEVWKRILPRVKDLPLITALAEHSIEIGSLLVEAGNGKVMERPLTDGRNLRIIGVAVDKAAQGEFVTIQIL